jgi:hypothetical protein
VADQQLVADVAEAEVDGVVAVDGAHRSGRVAAGIVDHGVVHRDSLDGEEDGRPAVVADGVHAQGLVGAPGRAIA